MGLDEIQRRAEMDLLLFKDVRRVGIECTRVDAPVLTPPRRIALADLPFPGLGNV